MLPSSFGFSAKIIADSAALAGSPAFRAHLRLTTMELCYPRFIHSEFMTHRVFSRNSASSRAIPVMKMIEQVRSNPAMPVFWGRNQPGMQAAVELEGEDLDAVKQQWLWAAEDAVEHARLMTTRGAHKQIVNRLLEPWQWMKTIVTATEWDNFWELRCHPDAQPEMQHLANLMREAYVASKPASLKPGEWHLPYITASEKVLGLDHLLLVRGSAGRCARVSYLNHDGTAPDLEKDVTLCQKLTGSKPIHASPTEHQGTPDSLTLTHDNRVFKWDNPKLHGNLHGWIQHRKLIEWTATAPVEEATA